eukprot:4762377-Prymnesium_polylepis.1
MRPYQASRAAHTPRPPPPASRAPPAAPSHCRMLCTLVAGRATSAAARNGSHARAKSHAVAACGAGAPAHFAKVCGERVRASHVARGRASGTL